RASTDEDRGERERRQSGKRSAGDRRGSVLDGGQTVVAGKGEFPAVGASVVEEQRRRAGLAAPDEQVPSGPDAGGAPAEGGLRILGHGRPRVGCGIVPG